MQRGAHQSVPDARAGYLPSRGGLRGALRGFANMFGKELSSWTGTRSWWLQPLVWLAVLIGPLLLPLYLAREQFADLAGGVLATGLEMFFTLAALIVAVGAVLLMHGSVIGERQLGTAAWVLSKPVSRAAFLLAKLTANAAALLVVAVLVPGVVAYGLLSLENGAALMPVPFLGGLALVAVSVLFYLALTLALGALMNSRGAVLAVALAVLLGGDLLLGLFPGLAPITPWLLGRFAAVVADGQALPSATPVVATFAWCVIFMAVGLVRFGREDL